MTRMNGSSEGSSHSSGPYGIRKRRSAANLVYWQQKGKSVPKTFGGVWKLFKKNATPRLFISVLGQAQDFYDFSIVSWVKKLMSEQYPVTTTDEALVSSMPILGAVVGMVVMGYLIDKIGRKAASMITPIIIIVSSVLSAAVSDGWWGGMSAWRVLALWRFFLGFGAGGEYPINATIAFEGAGRSRFDASLSILFVVLFSTILSQIFVPAYTAILLYAGLSNEKTWRLLLGTGAILGALVWCLRHFFTKESSSYEIMLKKEEKEMEEQGVTREMIVKHYFSHAFDKTVWPALISAGLAWFIFDIVAYGYGVYESQIVDNILTSPSVKKEALTVFYIHCATFFCVISPWLLAKITNKWLYAVSGLFFGGMLIFVSQGDSFLSGSTGGQIVILCIVIIAYTFGNIWSYLMAGEIWLPQIRGLFFGIAAAAGKLGAFASTMWMAYTIDGLGWVTAVTILGVFGILQFFWVFLFCPNYTYGILEDIEVLFHTEPLSSPDTYHTLLSVLYGHSGKQGTVMPFFIGRERAEIARTLHESWKARTEDSFDAMELSNSQH